MANLQVANNSNTRTCYALHKGCHCPTQLYSHQEIHSVLPVWFVDAEGGAGNILDGEWRSQVSGDTCRHEKDRASRREQVHSISC